MDEAEGLIEYGGDDIGFQGIQINIWDSLEIGRLDRLKDSTDGLANNSGIVKK